MNIHGLAIFTEPKYRCYDISRDRYYDVSQVIVDTNRTTHDDLNECLQRLNIRGVKTKSKSVKIRAIMKYNDEE